MKPNQIATALLILLTGCGGLTGQVVQEGTIDIGVIAILTGPGGTWGESTVNGAQMAVDEINAQGGVNGRMLELSVEDSRNDAKTVLSAYRKFHDIDGISYIIGTSWSQEGLPLIPIASQDDVVMISPSLGVAAFNEGGENLFNLWPHDAVLSARVADLVYSEGHRRVIVLNARDAWAQDQADAFVARFEELGGTAIVESVDVQDKSQNFIAAKVEAANVDAVMFTNTVTGDVAAKRLKEQGIALPMYSITMGADVITSSDGALDGLVFLTSLTPTDEFRSKYAALNPGEVLDVGADTAYDAVYLLAEAIRAVGDDPRAVAAYINGLETYQGASGDLTFDGEGGVTKEFVRFVVRDGVAAEA